MVWLEFLRELGAAKVIVYTMNVHHNIAAVLDHYAYEGLWRSSTLPCQGISLQQGSISSCTLLKGMMPT